MAPSATSDTNGSSSKFNFNEFHNVIAGKTSSSSETRHGINPATKKQLPPVPVCTKDDVDTTVKAAREAFKKWGRTSLEERRAAVLKYAEALRENLPGFRDMLTKEQGKPLAFAEYEVASSVDWFEKNATFDLPEEVVEETDEKKVINRLTPLGVVVGIVPWNFPILLACGKIAPALITGNCIILKPSPFTPYCGLKLAELAQQFFPPGVFQALSGDDNLGPWLTAHPGVDKISFTGSTFTGKKVMESAAKTLKRVTLELGGNDPAIICKDVDVEEIAPKVATMAFMNSGQVCIAIKRVLVHKDIYDKFRDAIVAFTKNLPVGEGTEEGVFLGPIQNEMQYEKVKVFLDDISTNNQKVLTGGDLPHNEKGYFISPTLIDNPPLTSKIVVDEPFGPVLPLISYSTEEEAIEIANDTSMGLGASVWSDDLEEAERIARRIDAGSVWINAHLEPSPLAPFGGHKESGLGVEWGKLGMRAYCNSQTLFLKKAKI